MARRVLLEELSRIQEQMNVLFEQASRGPGPALAEPASASPGAWAPAVDVIELADELVLLAELPGVRREEIELTVQGDELTIAGERRGAGEGERYLRLERSHGAFRRVVALPPNVDTAAISARLEHGVLEVRLAKRPIGRRRNPAIRHPASGERGET